MGNLQEFGGDWTTKKLQILEDYLKAYKIALKHQPFNLVYVDAFAGTGYRQTKKRSKEQSLFTEFFEDDIETFHAGSARIALEIPDKFDEYIFVEKDSKKVEGLLKLKIEADDTNIRIINDDANSFLIEFCETLNRKTRAVIFLDPFAMNVPWDTIKTIAKTEAIDLWYLFPLSAVNRLLKNNPHSIPHTWRLKLNEIFGCTHWYDQFYQTETVHSLFGNDEQVNKKAETDKISKFLVNRLKTEFCGVAKNPRVLKNSKNSPLFLLCFAASNPKGAKIANNIAQHILKNI